MWMFSISRCQQGRSACRGWDFCSAASYKKKRASTAFGSQFLSVKIIDNPIFKSSKGVGWTRALITKETLLPLWRYEYTCVNSSTVSKHVTKYRPGTLWYCMCSGQRTNGYPYQVHQVLGSAKRMFEHCWKAFRSGSHVGAAVEEPL